MTRPAEVRSREDAAGGASFDEYRVGERVGPLLFTLEPEFIGEYIGATGLGADLYEVDGRPAAPPQILLLYLMATLHQRYPPLPAMLMADLRAELRNPIWRDEVTQVRSEGIIEAKFERKGRRFVSWSAVFSRVGGPPLARITNTFVVPR